MVYTRSTVVRVPELTNAVIGSLVASCAPAAVMPLSAGDVSLDVPSSQPIKKRHFTDFWTSSGDIECSLISQICKFFLSKFDTSNH